MNEIKATHFLLLALKHQRRAASNIRHASQYLAPGDVRKFYNEKVYAPMNELIRILENLE